MITPAEYDAIKEADWFDFRTWGCIVDGPPGEGGKRLHL